jgi:hypothetical protein
MTDSRADFYQQQLDRVSRSFAFCIEQLPEPLRGWVGTAPSSDLYARVKGIE